MDKNAVLKQLIDEWNQDPLQEDEFTIKDLEELPELNLKKDAIRNRLESLISGGVLKKRLVRNPYSSGNCSAYSVAEGKTWEDVLQYIKKK